MRAVSRGEAIVIIKLLLEEESVESEIHSISENLYLLSTIDLSNLLIKMSKGDYVIRREE